MKSKPLTEVSTSGLRALLFWATIGVTKSRGGYRDNQITAIIDHYAREIHFQLPAKPDFRKWLKYE